MPYPQHPPHLPLAGRLASLDGWRAFSIILVLGSHCIRSNGFPAELLPVFSIFDGSLGVRMFFIISGFLITWLMLKEKETTGSISLKNFYIRRALRILPVYYTFLLALLLLQIFTPFSQQPVHWLGNLTFTTNFTGATWSSGHLWSLAVEEQFYFLWPGVFCITSRINTRLTMLVLAFPVIVAPLIRVVICKNWHPASLNGFINHYSFIANFDSLAFGCISAFLLYHKSEMLQNCFLKHHWRIMLAAVLLMIAPYFLAYMKIPARLLAFSGASLQAIGFSVLMLNSVLFPARLGNNLLNLKYCVRLGVLSYSIYIWHQIFCTNPATFGLGNNMWMSFPLWILSSLATATVSYYCLERPILNLRHRFR